MAREKGRRQRAHDQLASFALRNANQIVPGNENGAAPPYRQAPEAKMMINDLLAIGSPLDDAHWPEFQQYHNLIREGGMIGAQIGRLSKLSST